eukprot:TRINITY_DN8956_c0_g2_i1.p1 TRINITY_DN8956_c0_g2~~TRINITY_DN8956_c0_g2_i1.p1  ORF type:complete len:300 (-),score=53.13 TRINITY_DN8956_c0_g2_i1:342-1241(-)
MAEPLLPIAAPATSDGSQPDAIRQTSLRLASALGGATTPATHQASFGAQPHADRTASQRLRNRQAVEAHLDAVVQGRFWVLLVVPMLIFGCYSLVATIQALWICYVHTSDTCDLQGYVSGSVLFNYSWQQIRAAMSEACKARLLRCGFWAFIALQLLLTIPSVLIIVQGWRELDKATAQKCNSDVIFYTSRYVLAQTLAMACTLLLGSVFIGLLRYLVSSGVLKPRGARDMKKLPKVPFDADIMRDDVDGHTAECSICFDAFDEKKDIVEAPCGHQFHADCINKWQQASGQCPLCRQEI